MPSSVCPCVPAATGRLYRARLAGRNHAATTSGRSTSMRRGERAATSKRRRARARPRPARRGGRGRGPAPPWRRPGPRGRRGRSATAASPVTSGSAPRAEQSSAAPLAIASSATRPNGSGQRLGTTAMAALASAAITRSCGCQPRMVTPAAAARGRSARRNVGLRAVGAEPVGADHLRPPARQRRQRAGAGRDEGIRALVGHHPAREQQHLLARRRRRQGGEVDAVGQHLGLARRLGQPVQQPPAQMVRHGGDARERAEQKAPVGRACGRGACPAGRCAAAAAPARPAGRPARAPGRGGCAPPPPKAPRRRARAPRLPHGGRWRRPASRAARPGGRPTPASGAATGAPSTSVRKAERCTARRCTSSPMAPAASAEKVSRGGSTTAIVLFRMTGS